MCFTFLAAQGASIGDSLFEADQVDDLPAAARGAASRSTCRPTSSPRPPIGHGRGEVRQLGPARRLEGPRHRARQRGRVRATSSSRPAPSSGTARWACSRTRGSRPARARSPRRSPTPRLHRGRRRRQRGGARRSSGSPTRSTTSRPAAARRSSCSSRATCPVSRPCGGSAQCPLTSARKPLISGNWKMNLNHFEAIQTVAEAALPARRKDDYDAVDVSVHPPFTDLRSVQTVIESDQMSTHRSAPRTATGRRRARSPARCRRRCWPSSTCAT